MSPRCSLVLACAIAVSGGSAWANEHARVRALDPQSVKLLQAARDRSPTVRRLLDRIERSDLIIYVHVTPRFERPRAATSILSAVPEARFVLISITTFSGEDDRFLLLGHELQHAVELAEAPHVRDRAAMVALYEDIGWRDRPNVYETARALEMGYTVRREMQARGRAVEAVTSGGNGGGDNAAGGGSPAGAGFGGVGAPIAATPAPVGARPLASWR